jgi:hypothetical protein
MGGLFAGQKREAAARFSFLLMIPAITASGLLELREAIHLLSADDFRRARRRNVVAGSRRLSFDLVSARLSAKKLDGDFYRLSYRRRRGYFIIAVAGLFKSAGLSVYLFPLNI